MKEGTKRKEEKGEKTQALQQTGRCTKMKKSYTSYVNICTYTTFALICNLFSSKYQPEPHRIKL